MTHNQTVQMYIILDTEMLHSQDKLMLIKTHQLMQGLHLELQIFYFLLSEINLWRAVWSSKMSQLLQKTTDLYLIKKLIVRLAMINHRCASPYGPNFVTILNLFVSHWKNWPLSRGYFGSWGHSLVAIAIVELFQQESMHGMSASTKKVAVVEKWPYSGGSTVVPQTLNC